MDSQGGHQRRLTRNPATDMDPAFSPDGLELAFSSNRGGAFSIFLLDLNSLKTRRLTSSNSFDVQPSFSPDGHWIAFERKGDIYGVEVDKGTIVPIIANEEYEGGPSWGRK